MFEFDRKNITKEDILRVLRCEDPEVLQGLLSLIHI